MASVTSLGSGSGLDLEGLVTKLVAAEGTRLTSLQSKEMQYNTKISNVGQFNSLISSLQSSVQALQDGSKVGGIKATSSNASAFSVTAKSTASVGSHSVDVLQLAQGQRLVSKTGGFTSSTDALSTTDDSVASAKITITYGSTTGDGGTLEPNSALTPMTIDVAPDSEGKITLASVRDAINGKGGAVAASLVKESDGSTRLVLTGSNTGAKSAFSVDVALKDGDGAVLYDSTDSESTTTTGFSKLVYHPGEETSVYDVKQAATDAHITMDGVDVYRSNNSVSDLLDGVTLTLTGTTIPSGSTTSQPATLQVSRDSTGLSALLQSFVTAYNSVQTTIGSLTSYDATTKVAGPMLGDTTLRSMQTQLRGMLGSKFGATGNSVATLSDIGITMQKNGSLTLDSSKLSSAVSKNLDQVQSLLGAYDKTTNVSIPDSAKTGFAYKMGQLTGEMLSKKGLIQTKVDGLNQTVKSIDGQIKREQTRLGTVEALYRKQFTALDKAIATMKATSNSLTSQLASLPGVVSKTSSS